MATRIISAMVGVVIGVTIICLSGTVVLPVSVALLSILGVFELYRAAGCLENRIMTGLAFVLAGSYPFITVYGNSSIICLVTTAVIMAMFASYMPYHRKMGYDKLSFGVLVPFLLSLSMCSICKLHALTERHGAILILLTLCGAWIADSAAYFTGTFLGKHKLCPDISPKKTVEGFIGGVVFDGLFFMLFNFVYVTFFAKDCGVNYISSFFLGMICAALGTVGDLTASLIKRQCGIKDYGKIMPGHGGFMDRFDSVLFVAPFMYAYLSVINIYY